MRNIFTIILLVIGFTSTAQQLPQYSLYMFNEGIIDPTKVTRLALENAVSVAGTMLITEAVVSIGKKKKQPEVNPAMMGM